MALSDRTLEKYALKFICKGNSASNKLLSSVDVDHFYNKHTREAFKRVQSFAKHRTEIISWSDLISDPALSDATKESLKMYKKPIKANEKTFKGLFRNLDKLKKQRLLYNAFKEGSEALGQDTIDEEKLAEKLADVAAQVKVGQQTVKSVNIGVDANFANTVKKILTGKGMPCIPTGIKAFDNKNRGFFLGSAVTLGGQTGTGKTALADQLSDNMSEQGFSVCQVSLEMNEEELITRKLSRIAKVSLSKLIDPANKLNRDEKRRIYKAAIRYSNRLSKKGGQQNIRVPEGDVSIEEVLFMLKPFGYDVIIIDYITLLKGTDGDKQWQILGNILRFCKVFARTNNCVIIMLCQVDKEGELRYSRAMAEHSNNTWIFRRDENFKETKLIHVQQPKARMGEQFDFTLLADLEYMTITDVPENYEVKLQKKEEKSKVKKKEMKEDEWLKQF